jgi:hypothetical protein
MLCENNLARVVKFKEIGNRMAIDRGGGNFTWEKCKTSGGG